MSVNSDPVQVCDLAKVMGRYLHMSMSAIDCVFGHGQVKLNGRTLGNDERRLPYQQIIGQRLEVPGRGLTIGTRPSEAKETLF